MRVAPIVLLASMWVSAAAAADAQTIQYQAQTLDIQVGGRAIVNPQDLNDRAQVIENYTDGFDVIPAQRAIQKNGKIATQSIKCVDVPDTYTEAYSINRRGDTVGVCSMGPLGTDPRHAFVREASGNIVFIDVPGATQTIPTGISNNRHVVGFYYDPPDPSRSGLYRIHGFKWANGKFQKLNLRLPDTYTMPIAVNSGGQIIGEYVRFNPATNETLQHGWFLFDQGQFSLPFPDSFEWSGGPAIALADINDDGDIVGTRSNGDADWNGPFLYRAGTFFSIELPSGYDFAQINGMNDNGDIVGRYSRKVFDANYGGYVYQSHGFVATPSASTTATE